MVSLAFDQKKIVDGATLPSYSSKSVNVSYSIPENVLYPVILLANITTDTAYWFSVHGKDIIPFRSLDAGSYIFLVTDRKDIQIKQPIVAQNFRLQYKRSDLGNTVGIIKFIVDNDINYNEKLKYISGPNSIYYYTIPSDLLSYGEKGVNPKSNKRFYFFGDIHGDRDNTCPLLHGAECPAYPSSSSGTGTFKGVGSQESNCLDITILLQKMFNFSKAHNVKTDFFLEFPYKVNDKPNILDREIDLLTADPKANEQWYAQHDYIISLYSQFYPCFSYKKNFSEESSKCRFAPEVRFQYADIRQVHDGGPVIPQTLIYISINELNDLASGISALKGVKVASKTLNDYQKELEDLNTLVRFVVLSSEGRQKDFLSLMLKSEQYQHDITKYFSSLPLTPKVKTLLEGLARTGTVRYGKNYSKLKAQLVELDREGVMYKGISLAKLIEKWVEETYYQELSNIDYGVWNTIYTSLKNLKPLPEEWSYDFNLVKFDAILMDGYVISRSFRTYSSFPSEGKEEGKEEMKEDASDLVVVYTGAAHTNNYSVFFEQYLQIKPLLKIDRTIYNERCVVDENLGKKLM